MNKQRKSISWTTEQRAQHQAIRNTFRNWHPSPEELIASGVAAQLNLNVLHFPAQDLLRSLKAAREAAGFTLADLSARCGIDQPALSRLENGHTQNPTVDTLWRYAAAVGKRLVLATESIPNTTPMQSNLSRSNSARSNSARSSIVRSNTARTLAKKSGLRKKKPA